MNRALVRVFVLLFALPLFFSCGRGQQSSLSFLQIHVIRWAEQRMGHIQLSTCMDSAYWIGICWNLYQSSNDSVFRVEAEKYIKPLTLPEDGSFNSDLAIRSYLAFGKGYDATGVRSYRHEVWDLGGYLLADTVCINGFTVEALLWATAHQGCHCFRDAAEQWGKRWMDTDSLSLDILQGLGTLYAYTTDTVYRNALLRMNQTSVLTGVIDSLRLASVYCRLDSLSPESGFRDQTVNMLRSYSLSKSASLPEVFYLTEVLLRLSLISSISSCTFR